MTTRHPRGFTYDELLGTAGSGKCMDCKWREDSAVARACGCRTLPRGLPHDEAGHGRVLALAREAMSRRSLSSVAGGS